jgi:hypothetical protein
MSHYSIYWIRKEFAYRYYYKSGILYRFLKEYQHNLNSTELKDQYNFITNTFPAASLITHIKNTLQHRLNLTINDKHLEIFNDHAQAISLHIHEKHINFRCEMLHDAENMLFPTLRSFHPFLFIVGNDLDNYGWISPVSKERVCTDGQVLYS